MSKRRFGRVSAVWHFAPLALILGACAPSPVVVPGTPAPPGTNDASISGVFQTFNTAEVRTSELASTKATSPEVRAFAQMLVRDHNESNQRLSGILTSRNIQPLSSATSAEIQQSENNTYTTLQSRTGADFDRTYLDAEISHHRWVINQLDSNLIPNAQDSQLESYLKSVRGTEAAHLKEAERLRGMLGG